LRHTAYREAGVQGEIKELPSVQLEITPSIAVNPRDVSEKIEQRRFDELNAAEIEYLLKILGPLFGYSGDIDDAEESGELQQIRDSLEEYYTDMEAGGPPDHIKTIQEHAEHYTKSGDE
jgi:hypothetical protein